MNQLPSGGPVRVAPAAPEAAPRPAHATFPRGALLAAGTLVLVTVIGVAAVRLSGVSIREPDAAVSVLRELRFEDRPDGSIAVFEGHAKVPFDSVTGEAGFVRGTLRGLARERKRQGLGPEQPFELIGRADGRMTLVDPATGHIVDLESFGPTNAADFGRWLKAR